MVEAVVEVSINPWGALGKVLKVLDVSDEPVSVLTVVILTT